jgi:hypothetical protein
VWIAAAAVLALLAIYALTVLLKPHEDLAGTNSVALQVPVDHANPGERVCTQVRVPPDASIVQVAVGLPDAERSTLRAQLRLDDGGVVRLDPVQVAPGLDYKRLPIEPRPETRPGDLCLTAVGSGMDLGGAGLGRIPGDRPLRIGSRERPDADLSVRYLRSEDTPSLLSVLPHAPTHSEWFRPGPVGAWLHWLIPLLVLPALAYAGLRHMATAGVRRPGRLAVAMAAIAFGCSACWAFTTPMFEAPDESEHFAYAQYLAETGNLPEQSPGSRPAYSLEETYLLDGMRHPSSVFLATTRPRWLRDDERAWQRVDHGTARDNGGGYTVAASAHSPLYYGLLAPAYGLGSGADLTWRITLMRLVSALLAGVVAACATLTVRELLPSQPVLAAGAGFLVAFQPMVGFMGGAINNDMGVNATAAVALYLVVRALRRGLTVRLGIGLGLALVALPLAKIVGYGIVPAVVLGVLLAAVAWRRTAVRGLIAVAATVAVATLAWTKLLIPVLSSGSGTLVNTTTGTSEVVAFKDPLLFLDYFVQTFVPPIHLHGTNLTVGWPFYDIYIKGGFGIFGWVTIGMPPFVYRVILGVVIVLAILAVATAVRYRSIVRARWAPALVLAVAALGVVAFVAAAYTTGAPRPVVAEQGRYGFPALVPIAALAVFACLAFGRRRAPILAGALAGAMIALGIGGWIQALSAWYT